SRSFYVGKSITEDDIKAKFENGVLKISVPKEKPAEIAQTKYISIE
ncbi:MAG: Hsp20 family protein, partial [Trichococcus flocculiformis]